MSAPSMLGVWAGSVRVGEISAEELERLTDDIRDNFRWDQLGYHVRCAVRGTGRLVSKYAQICSFGTVGSALVVGAFDASALVEVFHAPVDARGLAVFCQLMFVISTMASLWRQVTTLPPKSAAPFDRLRDDMLRRKFNVADPAHVWVSPKPNTTGGAA